MAWTAGEILTAANMNTYLAQDSTVFAPATVGGLTKGSGVETARYTRLGPLIVCLFKFAFGSGSAITGDVSVTLPVTNLVGDGVFGTWIAHDDSAGIRYLGQVVGVSSTTSVALRATNAAGTIAVQSVLSSTVPFTWTTPDQIIAMWSYFAA